MSITRVLRLVGRGLNVQRDRVASVKYSATVHLAEHEFVACEEFTKPFVYFASGVGYVDGDVRGR